MEQVFLKFETSEAAEAALSILKDENGNLIEGVHRHDVGTIYKDTGAVDSDGMPVLKKLDGYHVNLLIVGEVDIEALAEFRQYPDTPSCVWAV